MNTNFHYIFPKQKWPATPLPPYYLNLFTFLQISPNLLQFIYKIIKNSTIKIFTQKLQKITQVLLMMLVTFIMSVQLPLSSV